VNGWLLLTDYTGANVRGWLMSEKLDGWRVQVAGGRLWTRGGHALAAPEWFLSGLPDGLDGELYAGRGEFNSIQGRIRDGWHGLSFRPFDWVTVPGSYARRLRAMQALALPAHAAVVDQVPVASTLDVLRAADAIVAAGGEGVVVRDPRAVWQAGRSGEVLRWVPQSPACNRRAA
jgi:DNA ligase-1